LTTDLKHILDGIAGYLEYQRDEGVLTVEVSPETRAALKQPSVAEGPGRGPRRLELIAADIAACTKCVLHEKRTQTVPGQGSPSPEIMFIGEAPGFEEDRRGQAFIGKAGQLLTKMITAMGFTREEVFIGNVVKCRPPGNRTPMTDEIETCLPYLEAQIATLQPKVIVTLGAAALKGMLGDPKLSITRMRGKWLNFAGIDLMPTFHPAYLLRAPSAKKDAWEDLKAVLKHLGRPIPKVRKQGGSDARPRSEQ
jgi:DNA polymerase